MKRRGNEDGEYYDLFADTSAVPIPPPVCREDAKIVVCSRIGQMTLF